MNSTRELSRSGDSRPNILVLVLDCARSKSYWFGTAKERASTPCLESLSNSGTLFPNAVAPSNWTIPSHFSILTGQYPSGHGVRTFQRSREPLRPVSVALRALGYETSLFSENHLLQGFGLEEGFDVCDVGGARGWDEQVDLVGRVVGLADAISPGLFLNAVSRAPVLVAPVSLVHRRQETSYKREVSSARILEDFRGWLGTRSGDRPFFTLMNWLDTHDPYEFVTDGEPVTLLSRAYTYSPRMILVGVPEVRRRGSWGHIEKGYVRSLEAADRKLSSLLKILLEAHERDRTILIITADHGQAFGEGGSIYHGSGVADSVTRVPLVYNDPRPAPMPRRIDRWVTLCELRGWIERIAGGELPFESEPYGKGQTSLVGLESGIVYCEGAPPSDHLRSLQELKRQFPWNHRLLAAYRGDQKFVLDCVTSEIQEWDLSSDPDSQLPQRPGPDAARSLREEIFQPYEREEAARVARTKNSPEGAEVSIDRRLKSWGYE